MRVTNNMILRNSSYNINGTKGSVNSSMNQMTTQKKINKPSEDPVVAIRSLRLSTSLSRVDQYYKKNPKDAYYCRGYDQQIDGLRFTKDETDFS